MRRLILLTPLLLAAPIPSPAPPFNGSVGDPQIRDGGAFAASPAGPNCWDVGVDGGRSYALCCPAGQLPQTPDGGPLVCMAVPPTSLSCPNGGVYQSDGGTTWCGTTLFGSTLILDAGTITEVAGTVTVDAGTWQVQDGVADWCSLSAGTVACKDEAGDSFDMDGGTAELYTKGGNITLDPDGGSIVNPQWGTAGVVTNTSSGVLQSTAVLPMSEGGTNTSSVNAGQVMSDGGTLWGMGTIDSNQTANAVGINDELESTTLNSQWSIYTPGSVADGTAMWIPAPAWQTGHYYSSGTFVSTPNQTTPRIYKCTGAGISASSGNGPSTTGTGIADANASGTGGSGGSGSYTVSGAGWTTNQWVGNTLTVGSSTFTISSNTATVLTLASGTPSGASWSIGAVWESWGSSTAPAAYSFSASAITVAAQGSGSTCTTTSGASTIYWYASTSGTSCTLTSGTGGSGSSNSYSVSGASWTANQLVSQYLTVSSQHYLITGNTSNALTLASGTPSGSSWSIGGVAVMFGIANALNAGTLSYSTTGAANTSVYDLNTRPGVLILQADTVPTQGDSAILFASFAQSTNQCFWTKVDYGGRMTSGAGTTHDSLTEFMVVDTPPKWAYTSTALVGIGWATGGSAHAYVYADFCTSSCTTTSTQLGYDTAPMPIQYLGLCHQGTTWSAWAGGAGQQWFQIASAAFNSTQSAQMTYLGMHSYDGYAGSTLQPVLGWTGFEYVRADNTGALP